MHTQARDQYLLALEMKSDDVTILLNLASLFARLARCIEEQMHDPRSAHHFLIFFQFFLFFQFVGPFLLFILLFIFSFLFIFIYLFICFDSHGQDAEGGGIRHEALPPSRSSLLSVGRSPIPGTAPVRARAVVRVRRN